MPVRWRMKAVQAKSARYSVDDLYQVLGQRPAVSGGTGHPGPPNADDEFGWLVLGVVVW